MLHSITTISNLSTSSNSNDANELNLKNVYHLFLRYLLLNLKESSSSTNSSSFSSASGAANSTMTTNNVWRTFKGRLYTRLHDKRIAELDLTGMVNVGYLFFVLIKCFSNSLSINITQLKYEQFESFFRVLNVFIKAKSLNKIDQLFSVSSSSSSSSDLITAKTNASKILMNTKFAALRLWYDTVELLNDSNGNSNELDAILSNEFSSVLNNWISEVNVYNQQMSRETSNSNQIAK
jgi:hypothetical protein